MNNVLIIEDDTLKIFCIWKSYVLLDEFQLLSHNGYY